LGVVPFGLFGIVDAPEPVVDAPEPVVVGLNHADSRPQRFPIR